MTHAIQPSRGSYLSPSFEHATVADVMHPGVVSCPPDAPLVTVAQTMATHHVHSVVVSGIGSDAVRGEHLVWGLVTDMDVVRAAEFGIEGQTAESVARSRPLTVEASALLATAARLMDVHGSSHLIVVSNGAPLGVLSSLDIAGALAWGRA